MTDARLSRSAALATLVVVSGQASTDYAAVLLVVLAIVAGTFSWAEGHALADGVQHAFARALCIARGGDCDVDALPCVTASDDTRLEASLKIAFIRLDGRTGLLRQTRSDGTVVITRGALGAAGLTAGVGSRTSVRVGRMRIEQGMGADASVTGLFERSQGWIVHGEEQADRLVARLRHRGVPGGEDPVALPPPDITTDRRGLRAKLAAKIVHGWLGGALDLEAGAVKEVRVDHTTGRRTLLLERDESAAVSLGVVNVRASGERDARERYGVTLDRDGRPVDLVVWRQGELRVAADLPRRLQLIAGLLATPTRGGRLWVQETHLDLTDPTNLALARPFLAQVGGSSLLTLAERLATARALAARLDAVGVEHVRTMAVDSSRLGVGEDVSFGLRLGGSFDRTTIHQRLLDAATRGIDGVWRRRADCVGRT